MKIIPFGCSHMASISSAVGLKNAELCSKVFSSEMNGIIGGNSNEKIIEDVYRVANNYGLEPKFHGLDVSKNYSNGIEFGKIDLTDTVFYIQTTYTNRLWFPTTLDSYTSSFHSFQLGGSLLYINNKFAKSELKNFYEIYIKYFWNYYLNLLDLLQKIDMLQTYLKSKNIPFVHIFWTFGGNTNEWEGIDLIDDSNRDLSNIKKQIDLILDKIDFVKPYGHNTVTEWTTDLITKHDKKTIFAEDAIHLTSQCAYRLFNEVIHPACNNKINS